LPARQDVRFAPDRLADELRKDCTELAFAYLMGSARDGCVRRGADLDLAVYFTDGTDIDYSRVCCEGPVFSAEEIVWDEA